MILKNGDIISVPVIAKGVGTGTAGSVIVTITHPTGLTFLDFTTAEGSYVDSGASGIWTLGDQVLNFAFTGTIRYTVVDSCEIPFDDVVVVISFDGIDYPIENNTRLAELDYESCCEVQACMEANAREQFKQVWVDSEEGDDSTAALQRFDKPYETIQQALTDIAAEVDDTKWTVNIRGYFTGVQADLVLTDLCVLNFENVVVAEDFVLDDVIGGINSAYITGMIRTESVAHVFYTELDSKIVFKDIVIINNGTAKIIDGTAVTIYLINTTTNTVGNNAPIIEAGQTLVRIAALN